MVTHQLQVERRTAKGHRPKTDALPLDHNNQPRATITSGYATWFTAGGAIRIAYYDVIDDVITGKL